MKRIILTLTVLAFAVAVQADDTKTTQTKEKPACCASKTKVSEDKEEGGCPFAKMACCGDKKVQAKKDTAKQPVLLSPKATDTAR